MTNALGTIRSLQDLVKDISSRNKSHKHGEKFTYGYERTLEGWEFLGGRNEAFQDREEIIQDLASFANANWRHIVLFLSDGSVNILN